MKSFMITLASLAVGAAVLLFMLWAAPERQWAAGALAVIAAGQVEEALIKVAKRRAAEEVA